MEAPGNSSRCPGCGGLFPASAGPVHRYMESSPGCWAVYGEVLAREYGDADYFDVHPLTVDAYAAQHPGQPSPQSIQSVAVHLIGLCLTFEHGLLSRQAVAAKRRTAHGKAGFRWLEPPLDRGRITAAGVHRAGSAAEHVETVNAWAESVWAAWATHHGTIRAWAASHSGQK